MKLNKPFDTYKWRWLSVQPSEGLLKAPVFLGVLRALSKFEEHPYSSENLYQELKRVESDIDKSIRKVKLARDPVRNLFRNSGQYWRGTGLVKPVRGIIELTELGRNVASGEIARDEFATLMVLNTVLPNPATYEKEEIREWNKANLRIKPFKLILSVMSALGNKTGISEAYLTANELIKIIIPLAGAKVSIDKMARYIRKYRYESLDISEWPDCANRANDRRLAREFLLFLVNFGVCRAHDPEVKFDSKVFLQQIMPINELFEQDSLFEDPKIIDSMIQKSQTSEILMTIERNRVLTNVLSRVGQPKFRKSVFNALGSRCILTHENTVDVLEAAHIVPISHGGLDEVGNGLCMRVDIHRLYDKGKIKIEPNGKVHLNGIENSVSYSDLPSKVNVPDIVDQKNLEWRVRYL